MLLHARGCGDNPMIPVKDLEEGQEGVIEFIRGQEDVVERLSSEGITLKAKVTMLNKADDGNVELGVKKRMLSVPGDVADMLFVTRARPNVSLEK